MFVSELNEFRGFIKIQLKINIFSMRFVFGTLNLNQIKIEIKIFVYKLLWSKIWSTPY